MRRDVVLVDAGGTNIGSVRYALQRLGVEATMTDDVGRIRTASHVILPGVGAARPGMLRLRARGLIDVIRSLRQPVLGVCLGMQLLFEHSQEDDTQCLGIIPGQVRKIPSTPGLRVPHMGWNRIRAERNEPMTASVGEDSWVYFVHSYAASISVHTIASSEHGERFSAMVRRENFFGMQFHPERSAACGARLLQEFLRQ
ncbi:MAG TPA: imidazole glycerol phosphate synthase subunit HisH [Rudaea sp.]|nr:imidazole glycerol phosphate synthase subunit HisH [Rudaea sp.]